MVVVIDQPSNGVYYGGQVAAPVFARVMAGAMRLMGIAPDDAQRSEVKLASFIPVAGGRP